MTSSLNNQLEAQTDEHTRTQVAMIIGLPKSMFTFDTEGPIVRISQLYRAPQR